MNKHHGSKFDTYLKEKGTFDEVKGLAQKRWEALQTEEPENVAEITGDSPSHLVRFFPMAPACLQPLETSGMKKNKYSFRIENLDD